MMKEKTKVTPVKFPFFKTVLGCYDIFFSKFWSFMCLGGGYAILMTLVFFISGQDVLCFKRQYNMTHFCTQNGWNYILVHALSFFIFFLFMQKWHQLVTFGKKFEWKKMFLPNKETLKMVGMGSVFLLIILISVFCLYLLYAREPNPNWKIELVYFIFISTGFILPILSVRFFSYFAYISQKESLPSPIIIWKKTSGNMFALVGECTFLVIVALFLMQTVIQQTNTAKPIISHALFLEFLAQLSVFAVLSCLMNYCDIQKSLLEKDFEDEKK